MRAAFYQGAGGGEVIELGDAPDPEYGSDEALIEVAYAGLNRADVLERAGRYGGTRSERMIPGLEFSGVVRAVGRNVDSCKAGDRVCGLVPGGAHAQLVAAPALTLSRVPDGVSLRDAAALPEAFLTAYDALFTRGRFGLGKTALVHAVGSSVGLAALALAKKAGGTTLGTSRTETKLERAREHGLDLGLLLNDGWPQRVRDATGGRGADCILDFIGGPILESNVTALATLGTIVHIGSLGGTKASLALGPFMAKRATLVGTVLRARSVDEKIELARLFSTRLGPLFARGELRAEVDRVVPLAQLAEAHGAMEANENFGKIVIAVAPQA